MNECTHNLIHIPTQFPHSHTYPYTKQQEEGGGGNEAHTHTHIKQEEEPGRPSHTYIHAQPHRSTDTNTHTHTTPSPSYLQLTPRVTREPISSFICITLPVNIKEKEAELLDKAPALNHIFFTKRRRDAYSYTHTHTHTCLVEPLPPMPPSEADTDTDISSPPSPFIEPQQQQQQRQQGEKWGNHVPIKEGCPSPAPPLLPSSPTPSPSLSPSFLPASPHPSLPLWPSPFPPFPLTTSNTLKDTPTSPLPHMYKDEVDFLLRIFSDEEWREEQPADAYTHTQQGAGIQGGMVW